MFFLENIALTNFRCYDSLKESFSDKTNIIVGNNATGKTSLVEAIYYLGVAKSHKAKSDDEIIKHNQDFSMIKGYFENGKGTDEVVLTISKDGKKIIKNKKPLKSFSEYLGYFNAVMFCPEDVGLITGAPLNRRKFLDINIGQINSKYLNSAIKYRKILKQRNELLKSYGNSNNFNDDLLSVYTKALIEEAKIIISEREKFISDLNRHLVGKCLVISGKKDEAKIIYNPNCLIENLESEAKSKNSLDKLTKTTNWGPHRDDFYININDMDSSKFASQGQQKTLALSIKLGVADLIKQMQRDIIVILDDVFGELDSLRQNRLLDLLKMSSQIFITTTSVEFLSDNVLENSKIIYINNGGE